MPRAKKKSTSNTTLVRYVKGADIPVNIYDFVDSVHNILYKMEGLGVWTPRRGFCL